MSLIKQLWLAIITVLLLAFVGSLTVAVTSSRAYIEQEIRIKNADNANALALAMTQLPKDDTTVELLLSAQFDTGHYRVIRFLTPTGEPMVSREDSEAVTDVPGWFVDLVDFDVPPGTAVVQDRWRQFGQLELQSQHAFAYHSLWRSTLTMTAWFAAAGMISLLIAYLIVRHIRGPLNTVTQQAHDIGQRRFTTAPLPRTRELRAVSEAMNRLSASVKDMLEKESEQIDRLRRQLLEDKVTGALTREAFLDRLRYNLSQDDESSYGTVALVRANGLARLNERIGHQQTDALLQALSQRLADIAHAHGEGQVGRLNGSDFALLLCGEVDSQWLRERLDANLGALVADHAPVLSLPAALSPYQQGDERGPLLAGLDGALSAAEGKGQQAVVVCEGSCRETLYQTRPEWREALTSAMAEGVLLGQYPVIGAAGHLLHHEAPVRLLLKGEWRQAGVFLPWISRLKLHDSLDLKVVEAALMAIRDHGEPVGINLSHAAVTQPNMTLALQQRLAANTDVAHLLWLEVPESVARSDLDSFRHLCKVLQPYGSHLGMEHVGAAFRQLSALQDLGLSYVKLDATLIQNVSDRPEQQTILRGMATLCHSLAIQAIAEGVVDERDIDTLFELGLDGVTGPAVTARGITKDANSPPNEAP